MGSPLQPISETKTPTSPARHRVQVTYVWIICSGHTIGLLISLATKPSGGSHLLMLQKGSLLSDVLLGQVDGWRGRKNKP